MPNELLKQIAASHLPLIVSSRKDMEAIVKLRADGLVIAIVPQDRSPVQVLAVTQRGFETLQQIVYPGGARPAARSAFDGLLSKLPWMPAGARRDNAQGLTA